MTVNNLDDNCELFTTEIRFVDSLKRNSAETPHIWPSLPPLFVTVKQHVGAFNKQWLKMGSQWAQCLQMRKDIFRFIKAPNLSVNGSSSVFGLKNHFAVIFVEISVLIRLYGICALLSLLAARKEGSHWSVISFLSSHWSGFIAGVTSTNISPSTWRQGAFIKNQG